MIKHSIDVKLWFAVVSVSCIFGINFLQFLREKRLDIAHMPQIDTTILAVCRINLV